MSNLVATSADFKLSDRISIVGTVTRAESKLLARQLFGNIASCATKVSATAAHDDFVQKCVSLAISEMVEGDHSRLDRFEQYAKTLPEYKEVKRNGAIVIAGKLGDLIRAYRGAVSYGAMVRQHADFKKSDDVINLSFWLGESATFGALVALPKKEASVAPKVEAPKADQPKVETIESAASKAHKEAIDKNWFNRALNTCDRDGLFNPMTDAVAWNTCAASAKLLREKQIADAAEKAARNVETLVGMFSQLFADQPEQAERHLREMAELAGFTVRRATVKRVNPIKEEKAA